MFDVQLVRTSYVYRVEIQICANRLFIYLLSIKRTKIEKVWKRNIRIGNKNCKYFFFVFLLCVTGIKQSIDDWNIPEKWIKSKLVIIRCSWINSMI